MAYLMRKLTAGHQVYIVDTKREFSSIFGKHKQVTVFDLETANDAFDRLVKLADERQVLFEQAATSHQKFCRNFGDYFKLTGIKLPVVTLVLEELTVTMQETNKDRLIRLLSIGRSAGIYVCAVGQYLRADILDRAGTVNFTTRVYLGPYDRQTVNTLFQGVDKQAHEEIKEYVGAPGKAYVHENGKLTTRYMPLVSDSILEEFVYGGV